jgi:hypothetical protein
MMMDIDMERARREELRWVLLRALYAAQEIGTSETILRKAIEDVIRDVTDIEIRRALDYLTERELIAVERKRPVWFAKINNHGIDFVEYTVDAHPGIARPNRW